MTLTPTFSFIYPCSSCRFLLDPVRAKSGRSPSPPLLSPPDSTSPSRSPAAHLVRQRSSDPSVLHSRTRGPGFVVVVGQSGSSKLTPPQGQRHTYPFPSSLTRGDSSRAAGDGWRETVPQDQVPDLEHVSPTVFVQEVDFESSTRTSGVDPSSPSPYTLLLGRLSPFIFTGTTRYLKEISPLCSEKSLPIAILRPRSSHRGPSLLFRSTMSTRTTSLSSPDRSVPHHLGYPWDSGPSS